MSKPGFPLQEYPNEKRCECGHRFSFFIVISGGIHLSKEGTTYALACPDCGTHHIIATSHANPDARVAALVEKRARNDDHFQPPKPTVVPDG